MAIKTKKRGFEDLSRMETVMENDVLEDIVSYATQKLVAAYGFCGVAKGPKMAMLNSSDGQGNDIKIDIKLEEE